MAYGIWTESEEPHPEPLYDFITYRGFEYVLHIGVDRIYITNSTQLLVEKENNFRSDDVITMRMYW